MEEKFKKDLSKKEILEFINKYLYVDKNSNNSIHQYFYEQFYFSEVPSDKKIVIEHYSDEKRKYAIFHTLFGRRVNDCLSRAVAFAIGRQQHKDVEVGINDNGFYLGYDKGVNALKAFKALEPKHLRQILENAIENSEVFKRRFRHCAMRSLMILRNYKGRTKRVGRQAVSSKILMSAVKRIDPNFTILKEARREVLEDLMDFADTQLILDKVADNKIKVKETFTQIPSPFAFNLISQGIGDVIKIEEKQEFLKRIHQMILAKISLGKNVDKEILKENQPPEYEELFKKIEKKELSDKEKEIRELKLMILNLKKVPGYAKDELIKLIDGEKYIRQDVIDSVKKYQKEIKKTWPQKLQDFVFEKLK